MNTNWSLEVYPPKTADGVIKLKESLNHMCDAVPNQKPEFIDVTFCAGSIGISTLPVSIDDVCLPTLSLCDWIQTQLQVPSCAHMVLRGLSIEDLHHYLEQIQSLGITRVMALRGDNSVANTDPELVYAKDLVSFIRNYEKSPLKVMVASYPEGHPECHGGLIPDIKHLEEKMACGAESTITQFFLDSATYLSFRRQVAPSIKVIPGIILLTSTSGLWRMIKLSGGSITVPPQLTEEINGLDSTQMREWGLQLACRLCRELYDAGERFFHIYTLNADETVCQLIRFINQLR